MICVSLGRARHKRMIAEHQFVVEQGAELVELRLDHIGGSVNLSRLLDKRPGPAVVSVRRREDGGRWMKSEEERLMLLRSVIATGVEYIDIEEDIADQIPRYGNTKRIISYHNMEETPEHLEQLHQSMAEKDPDIIKIATTANSFSDNGRMLTLCKNAHVPTIGICMGDIGVITRILANRVGSPFTYAAFTSGKPLAPGQLDWREMTDLYHCDTIDADTEFFGVIADPVAHSYSPLIHNRAFADQKLNARYLPLRVASDDLQNFMMHCRSMGINGVSVTIPHKEAAIDYCSQAESSATGIGAVNTMVFHGEDTLGYNTDYRAAMDCIQEAFGLGKAERKSMGDKRVMVLGAGGVSRAIAWGLRQRNAEVMISSRNHGRAQALASELGCQAVEWDLRHHPKVQLLVNGTPVGMHPDVDNTPYNATSLNEYMTVFDTVYNPESTLLIKHARLAKCNIVTGVDMFVRQAAYQFKIFTGREAQASQMRDTIKQATNPVQLN